MRFSAKGNEYYEFIAFVCWYIFLILCCIVPTICAYRRRRIADRRNQETVNSFRLGVGNDYEDADDEFILNHLRDHVAADRRRRDDAREKVKKQKIVEKLAMTKMVVSTDNIRKDIPDKVSTNDMETMNSNLQEEDTQEINTSKKDKVTETTNKINIIPLTIDQDRQVTNKESTTITPVDWEASFFTKEYGTEEETEDNFSLFLPKNDHTGQPLINGGPRQVSNTCAICICHYKPGDEIVWSDNPSCQHAFHEECITLWLMKKEEPLCPCCRQAFIEINHENNEPLREFFTTEQSVHFLSLFSSVDDFR